VGTKCQIMNFFIISGILIGQNDYSQLLALAST
jgi:hypothetical protein